MILSRSSRAECPTILLEQCLAKTRNLNGLSLPGRTVEQHCRLVGAVAAAIMENLPTLGRFFPKNSPFAVATHDVGKVFPYFQRLIHDAVNSEPQCFHQLQLVPSTGASVPHHSEVSWATLRDILGRESALAEVAGWHHGRAPVKKVKANDQICGGPAWQKLRVELIERLREGSPWPDISTEQLVVLKGLTVVADWIGSGSIFDDPDEDWRPLVSKAVEEAGFIPFSFERNLSFQDIFGFEPNAIQRIMAQTVTEPGLYILEAPMGLGKTEAALFAAYRLLQEGQARGLYFALPTQLSSNKIYDRLRSFLEAILVPESCKFADPLLLHSLSWLYSTHDEDLPHASSWFEHNKRGLLAPFGVGTLDQALMSVINVRHPAVRSFGLAGKVVVLDEVHSYDTYTGTLINELVRHLRALDCTVIILSATLTRSRLISLADAAELSGESYPLVTAVKSGDLAELAVPRTSLDREVEIKIRQVTKESEALEEALMRAEQGQQILWIENTVKEAQSFYCLCAARSSGMAVEVGLLHSRFTPSDRQRKENYWTQLYGKNSRERGRKGRILIGTQVLEQSLDIDADFLVSRICPTDMLFQRMGRLWRHKETARPAGAQRECWIIVPHGEAADMEIERAFGVSGVVYSPYVLARTLEIWSGRDVVSLPCDIRPLLEATYAERPAEAEYPLWLKARRQLEEKRNKLRSMALSDLSDGQTLPDHSATRFIEDEQSSLLILRELGREQCLLADGQSFSFNRSKRDRREISAMLLVNIVKVRTKTLNLPVPINKSGEKRRLFEYWLAVKENYEGIYLARLGADASLEDLCTPGRKAGTYCCELGWRAWDQDACN